MINIKKNDWVQPTEVREEVVQAICDAFIYGAENPTHVRHTYHPFNGGGYRGATSLVAKPTSKGLVNVFGFTSPSYSNDTDIKYRFNGAEMKRAFEELINAGYYMLRVYLYYSGWMGYVCSKKPYSRIYPDAVQVTEFNDMID